MATPPSVSGSVSAGGSARLASQGDTAFANMDKVSAELFTMTYGALVVSLIKELRDLSRVNDKLESMGYSMGTRIVDEFLAKTHFRHCKDFHSTLQVLSQVGFRMFLGVPATVKRDEGSSLTSTTATTSPTLSSDASSTTAGGAGGGSSGGSGGTEEGSSFIIELRENPLNEFVELPTEFRSKLVYSNVLCGIIRGALEMLHLKCHCQYIASQLTGDETDRIQVTLIEILHDVFDDDD